MKHIGRVLFFLLLASAGRAEECAIEVFHLINERLSLMEDVAWHKFRNHEPVQNLERERLVLEKTIKKATDSGLAAGSVANFFQAQMDAGKAIQHRHLADWTLFPPSMPHTKDLDTEIRPELLRLGNKIIASINSYLSSDGKFSDELSERFKATVTVNHLNDIEKEQLYKSLQDVAIERH